MNNNLSSILQQHKLEALLGRAEKDDILVLSVLLTLGETVIQGMFSITC